MNREVRWSIAQNYSIPEIERVAPVKDGFLSHNFVVETSEQKYFFKQYRFDHVNQVKAAHEAKLFFSNACIPVILPLTNKDGNTILHSRGRFYSLFPFIDGCQYQRGHLPQQALESMAQMQAQIHRSGANVQLPHVRHSNAAKSYREFVESARLILSKIPSVGRTEFDERARESIHLKLHLAERSRIAIEKIQMKSDHLVHGDYQDANVFFNSNNEVSHVFDWEQTRVTSRELSLVRAIALVCFGQAETYVAEHSEENFKNARHFLAAYSEVYPIRRQTFLQASTVRYLHKTMSLWVETSHYLDGNDRVDVFLEADDKVLRYYAEHFDEYVERICGDILQA